MTRQINDLVSKWGAVIKNAAKTDKLAIDELLLYFQNTARVRPAEAYLAGNKYVVTFADDQSAEKVMKLLAKHRIRSETEEQSSPLGSKVTYLIVDVPSLTGSMAYRTLKQQLDEGVYDRRKFKI